MPRAGTACCRRTATGVSLSSSAGKRPRRGGSRSHDATGPYRRTDDHRRSGLRGLRAHRSHDCDGASVAQGRAEANSGRASRRPRLPAARQRGVCLIPSCSTTSSRHPNQISSAAIRPQRRPDTATPNAKPRAVPRSSSSASSITIRSCRAASICAGDGSNRSSGSRSALACWGRFGRRRSTGAASGDAVRHWACSESRGHPGLPVTGRSSLPLP